eukprot:6420832-Lingulodinium_polyedra.AAC.1
MHTRSKQKGPSLVAKPASRQHCEQVSRPVPSMAAATPSRKRVSSKKATEVIDVLATQLHAREFKEHLAWVAQQLQEHPDLLPR